MKRLMFALALSLAAAAPALAHCDSLEGPVVAAAREALAKGDVTPALAWVPAGAEREIREAFARTVVVRTASAQARELADLWFFETLVRVHRQSEGAPYDGLRAPGFAPEEGIALADAAIESGSLDLAERAITAGASSGLRARFARTVEARRHAGESVEAGRRFVAAYVDFIHYVERLHQSVRGADDHQPDGAHAAAPH